MKTPKRRKSSQPAPAPAFVSSPLDEFRVEKNGSWWLTETKVSKVLTSRLIPMPII